MKTLIKALMIGVLGISVLSSCQKDFLVDAPVPKPVAPRASMMDYIKYNYSFSMLYAALVKTGLDKTLADTSVQYTLMAPDDAAFAATGINADSLDHMDVKTLTDLLSYHILPGVFSQDAIPASLNVKYKTVNDRTLFISKQAVSNNITVNAISLRTFGSTRDIGVANGMIHVLTKALKLPYRNV